MYIYTYIHFGILRFRDSLAKSPQWEPSIPEQLNTKVIRGACETCTTSCKRGQLLGIRRQVLKHCKELLIRLYPYICTYIHWHIYTFTHIYVYIYIYILAYRLSAMASQALFAIFVQYDANLDGRVRGDEAKQLLKAPRWVTGSPGDDTWGWRWYVWLCVDVKKYPLVN